MSKEKKIYNKIILIGNGFDLALGLKTSYNDFIFWLLKTEILKSLESFPNQVIHKDYKYYNDFLRRDEPITLFGFQRNRLFDVLIKGRYTDIPAIISACKNLQSLQDSLESLKIEIIPRNNKSLFDNILSLSQVDWVDIEAIYFELLKENISEENSAEIVTELNEDLENISERLKEYLQGIKIEMEESDANLYVKQFYDEIPKGDIIEEESKIVPENIYFLNFNYTDSLDSVLKKSSLIQKNITVNQIHSNVSYEEPIIFGFGDEMDEVYKKIEELNDNRFFRFIKSFQYFKNNKYRELLRFLNSNCYQVCIYGHSCGLSDRIMLNEIFEHENCKSIKVYYYNEKDFTTKTMNISRHFNSNKRMREKVVNLRNDDLIPQINAGK